ncbi:MAG: metal-binding protein [Pelagibacterium sp. SCN 63-23]|nr:MAG: metal-binding protein [Pelagibacterium sp. SCN 63-23]
MQFPLLSRRAMLLGSGAAFCAGIVPAFAQTALPSMHVLKDPNCGCCKDWIAIVEQAGFPVTVEFSEPAALARHKFASAIPEALWSCHTATVEGYMIEGHVPVPDITRLLAERPDAIGLAVPGMPFGSPGMGDENARDAYDVILIRRDGSGEIFSRYAAA